MGTKTAPKETKDTTMLLRLSTRERAKLKLKAQAEGLSVSAYLRRMSGIEPQREAKAS